MIPTELAPSRTRDWNIVSTGPVSGGLSEREKNTRTGLDTSKILRNIRTGVKNFEIHTSASSQLHGKPSFASYGVQTRVLRGLTQAPGKEAHSQKASVSVTESMRQRIHPLGHLFRNPLWSPQNSQKTSQTSRKSLQAWVCMKGMLRLTRTLARPDSI